MKFSAKDYVFFFGNRKQLHSHIAESGQGPVPIVARPVGPRVGGAAATYRPTDAQLGPLVGVEVEAKGVPAWRGASRGVGQFRGVQDVSNALWKVVLLLVLTFQAKKTANNEECEPGTGRPINTAL